VVFIFFLTMFIGFVESESSTETHLMVPGCSFNYAGEVVTVSSGFCSGGKYYGLFYCDDHYNAYNTLKDEYGCSRGGAGDIDDPCCPSGMFCNKTTYLCQDRIENCYTIDNEGSCGDIGCIWMDDKCVASKADFSCDYYNNKSNCEADSWRLGMEGVGSEHCGRTVGCGDDMYYVASDDCSCRWYENADKGEQCQVKLIAQQKYSAIGVDPFSFSCSNSYSLGNCTEGIQNVTWLSNHSVITGNSGYVAPEECLDVFGCSGGSTRRYCGEGEVMLPFFDSLNLIVAFCLIGMFYYFVVRMG
jgi:hypothetical protein